MKKWIIGLALFSTQVSLFGQYTIREHVSYLCNYPDFRSSVQPVNLNDAAMYIHDIFQQYSDHVTYQRYEIKGDAYRNVMASFGPLDARRIIVCAHYDSPHGSIGANNNASGVAVLLALSAYLQKVSKQLRCRIDVVALEGGERKHQQENMGSYKHALQLQQSEIPALGVICLDEVGNYQEKKRTQRYPRFWMKLRRGSQGNFLAMVIPSGMGSFADQISEGLCQYKLFPVKRFKPIFRLKRLENSDMQNYIHHAIPVLLLTDTGKFRNRSQEATFDSVETLDYKKLEQLTTMLYQTLIRFRG
jgi:hypothetical protein